MTDIIGTRPAAGTQLPVPVTREHIDNGTPGDACRCVIALAILDAIRTSGLIPAVNSVSVTYADDGEHASARAWIAPGAWLRLVLGPDGCDLMHAFDSGEPVQPCTLTAVVA